MGGDVAVDFGVDLAHGDAEGLRAGVMAGDGAALGQGEGIDEGGELERVQHGDDAGWAAWEAGCGACGRHVVVHHLLREGGNGAGEEAEGGGLLQEGAAGGGQSVGSGRGWGLGWLGTRKKARTPKCLECVPLRIERLCDDSVNGAGYARWWWCRGGAADDRAGGGVELQVVGVGRSGPVGEVEHVVEGAGMAS